MKDIFETRFHSHLQRLQQAMIDRGAADVQSSLDRRGVVSGAVLKKNPCPLDFAHPGGARSAQSLEKLTLLWRENKSGKFRLSSHVFNLAPQHHSVNVLVKRYTSHSPERATDGANPLIIPDGRQPAAISMSGTLLQESRQNRRRRVRKLAGSSA